MYAKLQSYIFNIKIPLDVLYCIVDVLETDCVLLCMGSIQY